MSHHDQRPDAFATPLLDDGARMRLIDDNVLDYAIFSLDAAGVVASWNLGAERILGFTQEEMLGQDMIRIFVPEDRARGEMQRELRMAEETGRAEDERWHLRKDGSRFWASGILTALRDDAGHLRGYAKILRDFTERKQYQLQIEELNERLRQSMRETHHRVKNNLQVIGALIELQRLTGASTVPMVEIERLGRHVGTLATIHDLLTAEAVNGVDVDHLSTREALDKLIVMLQTTIDGRPIRIEVDDIRLPSRQATALAVLTNELVSNAVKHGSGEIVVRFSVVEARAHLEVCDRGDGFPAGFDAHRSAHTGLELIDRVSRWDLGGDVRYGNWPEGGARVVVSFPIVLRSPDRGRE